MEDKKENLILDKDQQLIILKRWNENADNPPSVAELIQLVWPKLPKEQLDARNVFGRTVKSFLIEKGISVPKAAYKAKGLIELSTEQKEYVANNYSSMSPLEMSRVIFNDNILTHTSQEAKSIYAFVKTLPKLDDSIDKSDEDCLEDYTPPNTSDRVCARINRYIQNSGIDFRKLSIQQKKDCEALISYLHNVRFVHQISLYPNKSDRMIFESSFIENCHDKFDLTFEDVDQYIILSTEKVIAANIQRTIIMLEEEQKKIINETQKLSMTLVEAIKTSRDEYNACIKRQLSLYDTLTQERSERTKNKIKDGANILNVFEMWRHEETRNKMIKIANQRREKLKDEIERLETMDDVIATIAGLDKSEILYN